MFKVFDHIVPFHHQQDIYNACKNAFYRINGWEDRDDIDISKHDLHSKWSLEDTKKTNLYPYVEQVLKKSGYDVNSYKYSMQDFDATMVNISKKGDYYYSHTHGEGCLIILYYANLEWREEWAGETIFFDKHTREAKDVCSYKSGRFIVFEGDAPHSVRPQSIIGPEYRFTIGTFLKKKLITQPF
jgi:Rps23 Pro-64 3,4-dihydroxylase Tpa1-like proline 4-hydroxylase|tara:strand:- start:185 stop:739 length:555 start_codon:yes stop_codon:yes gene_type:complete